jgi:hypothetical protein
MNTFQSEMRIAAHDAELKESKWDRASMVFLVTALPAGVLVNTTGDIAYFLALAVNLISHLLCRYMASRYSNLRERFLKQASDHEKREAFQKRCGVHPSTNPNT